jgi:hypothetical protein
MRFLLHLKCVTYTASKRINVTNSRMSASTAYHTDAELERKRTECTGESLTAEVAVVREVLFEPVQCLEELHKRLLVCAPRHHAWLSLNLCLWF